jgi:Undecaprenyl-phosphate glucose phosphotransferase
VIRVESVTMSDATASLHARYIEPEILQRVLKSADFAVLAFGALAMSAVSVPLSPQLTLTVTVFLMLVLALCSVLALRWAGLYDIRILTGRGSGLFRSILLAGAIGLAGYFTVNSLSVPTDPRWLAGWLTLAGLHFGLTRSLAGLWIRPKARTGAFRQRIAIVGGGRPAEDAISALESSSDVDVEIIGIFDDRFDERSPVSVRKYRKLGNIAELAEHARTDRIDLIIVAIPLSAEARLLQMLKRLWELPVDIRISGQASRLKLTAQAYTYLGKLPLLAVFDRPLSGWASVMKSVMDKVLAGVFIVALSPVMLTTAAAIAATSKGPVIFRQKRYGFNNEMVEVFKFRSMFVEGCDTTASKLVTRNDPRVTPVGRFIRKTSIDELPQLFNVLTGQLSLVGPRPHATQAKAAEELYEQVVDGYFARHKVKPGITGWAQINGWRGETDTHEKIENRVKFDLDYIDRWSLWFDLKIILKTPFALLKSENAY